LYGQRKEKEKKNCGNPFYHGDPERNWVKRVSCLRVCDEPRGSVRKNAVAVKKRMLAERRRPFSSVGASLSSDASTLYAARLRKGRRLQESGRTAAAFAVMYLFLSPESDERREEPWKTLVVDTHKNVTRGKPENTHKKQGKKQEILVKRGHFFSSFCMYF
jgi:hypothetical protein